MPTKSLTLTFADGGEWESTLYAPAKAFKSGSTGFWAGGKLDLPDGERYQVSCSIVRIGSKPTAE